MHRPDSDVDLSDACEHVAAVKIREVRRPGDACPECVDLIEHPAKQLMMDVST